VKNRARAIAPLLILLAAAVPAAAEGPAPGLTFAVAPGLAIPLGPGANYFSLGGGGSLLLEYPLALWPGLTLRGGIGYTFSTLQFDAGTTSEVSAMAGAAWGLPLVGGLSARFFAGAGYSFGVVNGDSLTQGGGAPVLQAGAGLAYALDPFIALRLEASYLYDIGTHGSLDISLGTALSLPGAAGVPPAPSLPQKPAPLGLEIRKVSLREVFPVEISAGADTPVGTAVIRNPGSEPLTEVRVTFLAGDSSPVESAPIAALEPGESREVPLSARLSSSLRQAEKPLSLAAEVRATAGQGEAQRSARQAVRLKVAGRNRVSWSNAQFLAAFVQPEDRAVKDLAGSASATADRLHDASLDRMLQTSIALIAAVRAAGVRFTPDRQVSYAVASRNPQGAGLLKYPGQTLRSGAGDQPDLVVLYASLFEALGMETAILAAPGHVLLAVRLQMTPTEAETSFQGLPGLIPYNGAAWLPINPSALSGGLLAAWEEGARIWGSLGTESLASFVSVRKAREFYPPMDGPSPDPLAFPPSSDAVARAFIQGLAPVVDRHWNAAAMARRPDMSTASLNAADSRQLRLLLSVGSGSGAAYSAMDSLSFEKSIALALRSIDGLTVIERAPERVQGDTKDLADAAKTLGADCWLRAEFSGARDAPVVRVQLYDVAAKSMRVDHTVSMDADLDARNAARERWYDLVDSVSEAYPTISGAPGRPGSRGIVLTVHALPGTRVTGVPGGPVTTGPEGTARIAMREAATCALRAELTGYFPAERSVFVDADRDLYFPQEPRSPLSVETGFENAFSPSLAAVLSFIPGVAWLRFGITGFGFGLVLDETQAVKSIPLWNLSVQAGMYFLPADSPVRVYAGLGPFVRLVQLPGAALRADPISPAGIQAAVGAEVRAGARARLFLEYAPVFYLSAFPDLLAQSFPGNQPPAGYIFTSAGALSFFDIRFGVRWLL
jgi:hypothetical protein